MNNKGGDAVFVNIFLGDGISCKLLPDMPGKKVIYTVFESDILPSGWRENLLKFDLVMTPSQWGAEILKSDLKTKSIRVVPEGVDPLIFHNNGRVDSFEAENKFTFLAIGKFEIRKSYEEIILAFISAFSKDSTVKLILRLDDPSYMNTAQEKVYQKVYDLIPDDRGSQIQLISSNPPGSYLRPEVIADLYRKSHCFVFPSKGEAWGLPLIEAISCGTPFISTYYSGHTEYLKHCNQSFSRISFNKERISDPRYLEFHHFNDGRDAFWAKPSVDHLAAQMINIKENWHTVSSEAAKNAGLIQKRFSWETSALKLVRVLQEELSFSLKGNN